MSDKTTCELPFDIAIVGLGIVGVHHMTREVSEVISRCSKTLIIDSGFGSKEYIGRMCSEIRVMNDLYRPGYDRLPTYREMATEVVASALAQPPVCFASYGHPQLYCFPTTLIKQMANILGLTVRVFPGVSSLDTLMVDLDLDPGRDGLQIYDASDLLYRKIALRPDVACVLLQASAVMDATYNPDLRSESDYKPLQDHLLQFYDAEHIVTSVVSKTFPIGNPRVERFQVGELASQLSKGAAWGTLLIKPTRR
jgi:precorrin-3B methylase